MKRAFMLLVGFAPTVPADKPPQTHAIEPAATGIGVPADLTFKELCSLPAQCGHVLRTFLITNSGYVPKVYQPPVFITRFSVPSVRQELNFYTSVT
jgi:hypothetical protein